MLRPGIGAGYRCLTIGMAGRSTNEDTLWAIAHGIGFVGSWLPMDFWESVLPVQVEPSCDHTQGLVIFPSCKRFANAGTCLLKVYCVLLLAPI
jgi:hypothetical protein